MLLKNIIDPLNSQLKYETELLDSLLSAMSNGTESWSYEYDNVGNITKITSGTKVITYQYDELNQLIRENNGVLGITVLYPVLRRKPRPT